jgi:transcriptional regulator with XRE-family HTH domain
MKDKLRTLSDIGSAVERLRNDSLLSTVEIAKRSGRSRDVLHRLERGQDVSLSSLVAILRVLGHAIEIVPAGRPTLDEMSRRFAADESDDE